ncbi:hypothetical protein ACI4CU_27260, partial [Klebsiella pneumoniae]|uniref:hypothetical protein n=1 Tax=Klebsiella pneumoniae TaxID=573 RepID=UPI0038518A69
FAEYKLRNNGDVESFVTNGSTYSWKEEREYYVVKYREYVLRSSLIPSGAVLMIDLTDDLKALQDNNYQNLDQPKADVELASALLLLALGGLFGVPGSGKSKFASGFPDFSGSMSTGEADFSRFLKQFINNPR